MKTKVKSLIQKIESDKYLFKNNFIPSWILYCLRDVDDDIKNKLINHIEESRSGSSTWNYHSENIIYPDDLDDTFSAFIGLYVQSPHDISGNTLSKLTQLLLLQEKRCGGPYKTWINHESTDIDPVVNSTILFFLSIINVEMPNLVNYIDDCIINNTDSRYYKNKLLKYYFYSRNYKGKIRDTLIKNIEKIECKTIFDYALKANIFLNLKEIEKAKYVINHLDDDIIFGNEIYIESIKNGRPFFLRSNSMVYALIIEVLSQYEKNITKIRLENDMNNNQLRKAMIYGSEAYYHFDKITDENFDPISLYKGIEYLRQCMYLLNSISNKDEIKTKIQKCFKETEKANLWECLNQRVEVNKNIISLDKKIKINKSLYYGKKSLAYIIERLIYTDKFDKEFLNCCIQVQCLRQLCDDTRDWYIDLNNGHITPANIGCYRYLRRKYKNTKADIEIERSNVANYFWMKNIKSICNLFDWHLNKIISSKYFYYFQDDYDFYIIQKEKIMKEEKCLLEFSVSFPLINQACTNLDHTALGRGR